MTASQLIYTACGRNKDGSFGVYSKTPDITSTEAQNIYNFLSYPTQIYDSSRLSEEKIAEVCPKKFAYFKLSSGRYCIGQSVYIGQKYSDSDKRYGNYFLHALVFDESELDIAPIAIIGSDILKEKLTYEEWHDMPTPDELPKIELKSGEAHFSYNDLLGFFNDERRRVFPFLLQAAINCVNSETEKLHFYDDVSKIKLWFYALSACLPMSIIKKMPVCSYYNDRSIGGNSYIPVMKIACNPSDSRDYSYTYDIQDGHYAFDFTKKLYNTNFELSNYVKTIIDIFFEDLDKAYKYSQGVDDALVKGYSGTDEALSIYYLNTANSDALQKSAQIVLSLLSKVCEKSDSLTNETYDKLLDDISKGIYGFDSDCAAVLKKIYGMVTVPKQRRTIENLFLNHIDSLLKDMNQISSTIGYLYKTSGDEKNIVISEFVSYIGKYCKTPESYKVLKELFDYCDADDISNKSEIVQYYIDNIDRLFKHLVQRVELLIHFYDNISDKDDIIRFCTSDQVINKCTPNEAYTLIKHLFTTSFTTQDDDKAEDNNDGFKKRYFDFYFKNISFYIKASEGKLAAVKLFYEGYKDKAAILNQIIKVMLPICNYNETTEIIKYLYSDKDTNKLRIEEWFNSNITKFISISDNHEEYYKSFFAVCPYSKDKFFEYFDKNYIKNSSTENLYLIYRALLENGRADEEIAYDIIAKAIVSSIDLFDEIYRLSGKLSNQALDNAIDRIDVLPFDSFRAVYIKITDAKVKNKAVIKIVENTVGSYKDIIDFIRRNENEMTANEYLEYCKGNYSAVSSMKEYIIEVSDVYYTESPETTIEFLRNFFHNYYLRKPNNDRAQQFKKLIQAHFKSKKDKACFIDGMNLLSELTKERNKITDADKIWLSLFADYICGYDYSKLKELIAADKDNKDKVSQMLEESGNMFVSLGYESNLSFGYKLWVNKRRLTLALKESDISANPTVQSIYDGTFFRFAEGRENFEEINNGMLNVLLELLLKQPDKLDSILGKLLNDGNESFIPALSNTLESLSTAKEEAKHIKLILIFIEYINNEGRYYTGINKAVNYYFKKQWKNRKELFESIKKYTKENDQEMEKAVVEYLNSYEKENKSVVTKLFENIGGFIKAIPKTKPTEQKTKSKNKTDDGTETGGMFDDGDDSEDNISVSFGTPKKDTSDEDTSNEDASDESTSDEDDSDSDREVYDAEVVGENTSTPYDDDDK